MIYKALHNVIQYAIAPDPTKLMKKATTSNRSKPELVVTALEINDMFKLLFKNYFRRGCLSLIYSCDKYWPESLDRNIAGFKMSTTILSG